MANVLMTDAYMRLGQHLQAHAAAVLVRKEFLSELPPAWRTRALEQWARTALTLGDKEPAFQELELLIHRENNPHLTLFLTEQLITDQQWQRAISVAKLLVNSDGDAADQARYKTVRALYQQAKAGKSFADFPTQARELAVRIQSIEMRGKCAELIGDAYTDLGQLETAADAYRGILR
jgi:tetratricopeptide (TPR) repeat protein